MNVQKNGWFHINIPSLIYICMNIRTGISVLKDGFFWVEKRKVLEKVVRFLSFFP